MQVPEDGMLLLVDKPLTWTSFDVVKKIKYGLKLKKIGHAGTLDPLATGLLLLGVGKYTKKLHDLQGKDKAYEGIFEIGKTTPSYDLETDFDTVTNIDHLTNRDLLAARDQLTGSIEQIPPAHSAVKVNGKRAYKLARKNEEVALKKRNIKIYQFELTSIELPEVHFKVQCSKGTYIRSLAHDFGKIMGVGAYLKALRRTAIGEYHVQDAQTIDEVLKTYSSEL